MAEIFDKVTKKTKPGIIFFEAPFKDVVVMIEEDGACKVIKAPRFVGEDVEWNKLLQIKVNDILNSL